ncbi:hypothetical protein NQZ68_036599 [Dissostichus eleginoides]|nr:hypothetical protein NQZ68_036599 [Dissostichus eleginoides]
MEVEAWVEEEGPGLFTFAGSGKTGFAPGKKKRLLVIEEDRTPGNSFRVMRVVQGLQLVLAASEPCSELAYVSDIRQASFPVDDDSLPESEIARHMCKGQHQQIWMKLAQSITRWRTTESSGEERRPHGSWMTSFIPSFKPSSLLLQHPAQQNF